MARYTEDERGAIDAAVETWKKQCLLDNTPLVFKGERPGVWASTVIEDLYSRFNANPYEGQEGGGTFFSKWDRQLEGGSAVLRLLAAELLLVHFLFASSVTFRGKLAAVEASRREIDLELRRETMPVRALHQKIGHPGSGSNTRRDVQVAYLIDFTKRFKQLAREERQRLLEDPWGLRAFADDTDEPVREMRHILLHLLRPAEFERISSGSPSGRLRLRSRVCSMAMRPRTWTSVCSRSARSSRSTCRMAIRRAAKSTTTTPNTWRVGIVRRRGRRRRDEPRDAAVEEAARPVWAAGD